MTSLFPHPGQLGPLEPQDTLPGYCCLLSSYVGEAQYCTEVGVVLASHSLSSPWSPLCTENSPGSDPNLEDPRSNHRRLGSPPPPWPPASTHMKHLVLSCFYAASRQPLTTTL